MAQAGVGDLVAVGAGGLLSPSTLVPRWRCSTPRSTMRLNRSCALRWMRCALSLQARSTSSASAASSCTRASGDERGVPVVKAATVTPSNLALTTQLKQDTSQ